MLNQGSVFACLLKSVVETKRSNWALEHKGGEEFTVDVCQLSLSLFN